MMIFKILAIVLGVSLVLAACSSSQASEPLPAPDSACALAIDWHKIVPGKSSRQDVIEILGQPAEIGNEQFGSLSVVFYKYNIEGGAISQFAQDRIFFRPDGVVDWIEAVIADRDGSFHTVQEIVNQIGNTLDTVYMNSNYDPSNHYPIDVRAGPDQLYIWSECGLALDILSTCSPAGQGRLNCSPQADQSQISGGAISSTLVLRHPNPYHLGGEPLPNMNGTVLMEFLFPPTSYKGFTDLYMHKIPYGEWDAYLQKVRENTH